MCERGEEKMGRVETYHGSWKQRTQEEAQESDGDGRDDELRHQPEKKLKTHADDKVDLLISFNELVWCV